MRVLLIGMLIFMAGCGMEQVDEGFRGIKTVWGKVEGEPLSPGLYFYNPVSSSIFEMEVREQKLEARTTCFTKDTQTVDVQFAITYYPDPTKIGDIYSQFGKYWDEKTVQPAVLGSIKDAIGQYVADDLVSKREDVKKAAQKEVVDALAQRGITATRLDIVNLDFNDEYERAVEDKVKAVQRAAEAKNKTLQVKEEADQKVLQAKADAEAMRIKANALTQNKALVEYEAVQKWDGKLPQYIFGNSMPMLNLGSLGK